MEAPAPSWLLTGASGFLGRHVLATRAESGAGGRVLALVRDRARFAGYDWTRELAARPVEGSVTAPADWAPALPRLDGIFHLAAVVKHSRHAPEEMLRTNVEGALAMVRLAAQHGCRLVVASSTGTVGCFDDPDAVADETSPWCEQTISAWPYYRSKLAMERRARDLADALGVELVIVRPPILLGPGDHRFRSTGNVLRALRRRLPFLIRGGFIFADVRDAAAAFWRAMLRPDVRPVYHLDGTASSVEEFFAMVEEVSGVPAPRRLLPYPVAHLLARAVQRVGLLFSDEPPHLLPDPVVIEMAAHHWGVRSLYAGAELGYKCRDPRETLRDTVAWLRENHPALAR